MYDLTGKIAIVTGGSQGIGFGICRELAEAGAVIYIIDINQEVAKDACNKLALTGRKAFHFICDVTNISMMKKIFEEIFIANGRLDILVNNAGVNRRKSSFEATEEDWDFMMDVNLKSTYFNSVNCARIMKERHTGRIINTCSIAAFMVKPVRSIYAISKVGVHQITKYLAREYAEFGITVNGIAPGFVKTPLNEKYFLDHPDEEKAAIAAIPMGHPATPKDLGITVRFLASDEAAYITGDTIAVDGGSLLR